MPPGPRPCDPRHSKAANRRVVQQPGGTGADAPQDPLNRLPRNLSSAGATVRQIFEREGEARFRELDLPAAAFPKLLEANARTVFGALQPVFTGTHSTAVNV